MSTQMVGPGVVNGHAAPLIAAESVTKSYAVGKRSVEILHGISLQVNPGELTAVMGPSGSGKSTLLYCLAGLEEPTNGQVSLLGRPLASLNRTKLAEMRRDEIGFVFQSYNLIPTLSSFENVALPFRMSGRKVPVDEIKALLTSLGLSEQIDSLPPTLSGGEQQRVALARVLAQQPQIIFADEPTGALDTRTSAFVLGKLVEAAHQPGRCALMVTHDPSVAARCDRVVFLRDGLVVDELKAPTLEDVSRTITALIEEVEAR